MIWVELLICVIGTVFTAYLANERRRGDLMALALLCWPAALIWLFLIWQKESREREIEGAVAKYMEASKVPKLGSKTGHYFDARTQQSSREICEACDAARRKIEKYLEASK